MGKREPQTIETIDDRSIHLEIWRDGKFTAKSAGRRSRIPPAGAYYRDLDLSPSRKTRVYCAGGVTLY
jgi:hypothetical protein